MKQTLALALLGLLGCRDGIAPQSQPTTATVETQTREEPSKIVIPIGSQPSPVPNPVALDDLRARWPDIAALPEDRARIAGAALNLAPGPCKSCKDESLARCALDVPADCPVVDKLVERVAVAASNPDKSLQLIESTVNYPDHWVPFPTGAEPILGSPTAPIRVDLFLDATGLFAFETAETLATVRRTHPDGVRVHLHPADTDVGRAIWQAAGTPQFEAFVARVFRPAVAGQPNVWHPDALRMLVSEAETHDPPEDLEGLDASRTSDGALAERVGADERPTWFVSGHRLRGAQSGAALLKMIRRERPTDGP